MDRDGFRRSITPVVLFVLLAVAGASAGCFWAPDLAMVRKDLERQLPGVNFEKDVELTLGPVLLAFTRMASRFVPEAAHAKLDYRKQMLLSATQALANRVDSNYYEQRDRVP